MGATVLYHRTACKHFLDGDTGQGFANNPRMAKKDEKDQEYLDEFSKRAAEALAHAKIAGSVRDRAKALGISKSFMEDIDKARAMPSALNIIKLAIRTGVNSDWLLTGRGEMVQELASGFINISALPENLQAAIAEMMRPYAASPAANDPDKEE